MVGANAQTVGHQILDLLRCRFTVSNSENNIRIGSFAILHKLLDAAPLRRDRPDLYIIAQPADNLHVFFGIRIPLKRNIVAIGAVLGIQIRTFHIKASNICALGKLHGFLDLINAAKDLLSGQTIGRRRQDCGGSMLQHELCRGYRIIHKSAVISSVAVDVNQTGAHIRSLGINDLTTVETTGLKHLAVILDHTVLNQYVAIRNQMIPHNKFRINNCDHITTLYLKM